MINGRLRRVVYVMIFCSAAYGCTAYIPGRQSYWDHKIGDLCNKEGQVKIFERVAITETQARTMARLEGKLATRPKRIALSTDPVYSETRISYLNETNPKVTREEVSVIRSADGKIVAKWIEYARVGGDMPIGIAHESAFRCPDPRRSLEQLQHLFILNEDQPAR